MRLLFVLLMAASTVAAPTAQCDMSEDNPNLESWQSGETKYEGFPLLLRRPTNVDYDALPPKLIVVTHLLDKTKPNGLPEPDYNETLFDFDEEVIGTFRALKCFVVLVETFGHKRAYYAYCPESVAVSEIQDRLEKSYSGFRLEWFERSDPTARFIRRYAKEHF